MVRAVTCDLPTSVELKEYLGSVGYCRSRQRFSGVISGGLASG